MPSSAGACVHWAHPHAASWFILLAVSLAARAAGWRVFYAYSDPQAGEIGTVYQACNWLYIGAGIGRAQNTGQPRTVIVDPTGREYSERWLRHHGLKVADIRTRAGWRIEERLPKHNYVWLEGSRGERRRLRQALRYPVLGYPKRG